MKLSDGFERSIELARNSLKSKCDTKRRAVVIGKFDGVHRGHQLLLHQLYEEAAARDLDFGAIAFHPDPVVVLQPGKEIENLMLPGDRVHRLLDLGLDFVVSWNFTTHLAKLTAREFLQLLHDEMDVDLILMGPTHRIGCDRVDFSEARAQAAAVGIEVVGLEEAASYDRSTISSSAIRTDIYHGRLAEASEKLSRPFFVSGSANTIGDWSNFDGSASIDFRHSSDLVLPPEGWYRGWLAVGGIGYVTQAAVADRRFGQMDAFGIDGDLVNQPATFYVMQQLLSSD